MTTETTATTIAAALVGTILVVSAALWSTGKKKTKEEDHDTTSQRMPLSMAQDYFMECHAAGDFHVVCCVELEGSIPTLQHLQQGVERLKRRYCALSTVVASEKETRACVLRPEQEEDSEGKEGERRNSVVKSGCVELIENRDWTTVADEYLNSIQFPKPTQDQPAVALWKVALVTSDSAEKKKKKQTTATLIFVLSHFLFDGTSRNQLVHEFLCSLSPDYGKDDTEYQQPLINIKKLTSAVPKLSAMDFATECSRYLWQEWENRREALPKPKHLAEPAAKNQKQQTKLILWTIDQSKTSRLVQCCREEQTTVQGALSAAAHRAFVRIVAGHESLANHKQQQQQSNNKKRGFYFGCAHLISTWPQVQEQAEEAALFPNNKKSVDQQEADNNENKKKHRPIMGGLFIRHTDIRVSTQLEENPWDLARHIKSHLDRAVKVAPLQFWQALFRLAVAKDSCFAISNLGRIKFFKQEYDLPDDGCGGDCKLQLKSLYANLPRNGTTGGLGVFNLQTIHGKMHVSFSYYTHLWSRETAHRFVELTQQELNDMIKISSK